jgi:heme exporter protein D
VSEEKKRNPDGIGHKVAFWFATACAIVSLAIFMTINMGKAESELTVDEREERDRRAREMQLAAQGSDENRES